MDPFIGEIRIFAGNFAPAQWALCNGQLLPIQQNAALFSILGTIYGGNGQTNFALPDLRGRAPMGAGRALQSWTDYSVGQAVGAETVSLTQSEMPSHGHLMPGASEQTTDRPNGAAPAPGGSYGTATGPAMAVTAATGANMPHLNMQPSLVLNFIIAVSGVYPPRP